MSDLDPPSHDGGYYLLENDDVGPPSTTDDGDSAIGDTESNMYVLLILLV